MFTVPKSLLNVPSPLNRLPSITVVGTRFAPTFAYPSPLDRYKPLSVCTLQTRSSASDRAVADVPCPIAATRLATAHAKINEPIVPLINFIFITVISLSLFWPSMAFHCGRSFLAVTGVMREIRREVTQKVETTAFWLRRAWARRHIPQLLFPTATRQFLCLVSLCSAWLLCGAN